MINYISINHSIFSIALPLSKEPKSYAETVHAILLEWDHTS